MSLADLPQLASITALSLGRAVLHLADGSSVEVDAQQPDIWASTEGGYLVVGRGEEAKAYGVPTHLQATLYAALRMWSAFYEGPPVLTLTGIDRQPDTVTFQAVNQEGQAVALTMPRPVGVQPSFPMPREPGEPVSLEVTHKATPGHGFTFNIYPETQEGRAMLELLGYAERFSLSLEGVQPSRDFEAAD